MQLICAALPAELKVAKELRAKKGVQFLCTWLGSYRTILTITEFLVQHHDVSDILFVGVCGWINEKHDLVQVANVINAHTGKEIILPIIEKRAPLVTMLSSEAPIHDGLSMQGHHYVDMESRGVALVAEQFRKSCTILRVPIDEIGTESCETFDRVGAIEQMRSVMEKL
jgi:purine-nucleoside phosphorylase